MGAGQPVLQAGEGTVAENRPLRETVRSPLQNGSHGVEGTRKRVRGGFASSGGRLQFLPVEVPVQHVVNAPVDGSRRRLFVEAEKPLGGLSQPPVCAGFPAELQVTEEIREKFPGPFDALTETLNPQDPIDDSQLLNPARREAAPAEPAQPAAGPPVLPREEPPPLVSVSEDPLAAVQDVTFPCLEDQD